MTPRVAGYAEEMTTTRLHVVSAIVVVILLLLIGGFVGANLPEPARPIVEPDLPIEWLARGLLLLAVMWVAIGAVAAHTRLVGKPGAAAARATWLSATTPWRARESTLGLLPLDRWLIFLVPVALLVATRILQSTGTSYVHLAIVIGVWTVFALTLRLVVGPRSPWPVIAAVGGVVVIRCILTLTAIAFTGAAGFSEEFWHQPALRVVFVAVAFMLFVWTFVAAGWALQAQGGLRYALAGLCSAVGLAIAIPAAVVAIVGAQRVLEVWDDGLGLLPYAIVELLPGDASAAQSFAWVCVGVGAVMAAAGAAFAVAYRRSA